MNDYYDYYTYSSPPTFNPLPTIISLVLCVFVLVCMWIVFRKAGKPGWAARCLCSQGGRRTKRKPAH